MTGKTALKSGVALSQNVKILNDFATIDEIDIRRAVVRLITKSILAVMVSATVVIFSLLLMPLLVCN